MRDMRDEGEARTEDESESVGSASRGSSADMSMVYQQNACKKGALFAMCFCKEIRLDLSGSISGLIKKSIICLLVPIYTEKRAWCTAEVDRYNIDVTRNVT